MGKNISRNVYRMSAYNAMQCRVFLDKTFTFFSLGLVLYGIAQLYAFLSKDSIIKHTVRCPYCRKFVSEKVRATRCSVDSVLIDHTGSSLCELHKLVGWT